VNLRQKLLLLFSFTVAAAVAAVAWTVLVRIRHVFDLRDQQETALFVSQFQREFQHRSAEVTAAVNRLAANERVRAMGFDLSQTGDAAPYLTEAQSMAQDAQLDFLEIVGPDGNVISSAQWPARFGYPEPAIAIASTTPFLKREELPDSTSALGIFAVHGIGGSGVRLIGGQRLDQSFLADLPVAPGMQIGLYSDTNSVAMNVSFAAGANIPPVSVFDPAHLLGPNGALPGAIHYQELVEGARKSGQQINGIVYPTSDRTDSLSATAIPLKNEQGDVMAVLVVGISRAGMVQAQQHIRAIAYGVAAGGILLAIAFSLWIAARVSRPIEQLAHAAEEVAGGNWDVRVPPRGRDEVSVLARSFNHMTEQLVGQRDRLVQSERVAAWRELARRLAHELKNPLFPLQLTVENLTRARDLPPGDFDEIFRESTSTLSAEIANLKTIIGRFSDFSKMPKPELEHIDAKDVVWRAALLHFPNLVRTNHGASEQMDSGEKMRCSVDLSLEPMPLSADSELLHRALSNLILNAMDAMQDGGRLTISAHPKDEKIEFRVSDTGQGLTAEECERLFTPYYTTKQHGTGLGLAIVQSVVADHAGTIAVESSAGGGATFIITLPRANV